MQISEFIKTRKIKSHMAAGFLAHLRLDGEREMDENHLDESYRQFAGLPDREPADTDSAPESGPEPTSGDSEVSPTADSSGERTGQSRNLSTAGRSSRRRGGSSGSGSESSSEDESQTGDE